MTDRGSLERFRLRPKDEEDRHRAKREQYARWREQRKLQKENDTT